MIGDSVVSVIASCLPKTSPQNLNIVETPTPFIFHNIFFVSFFAAFKVWHFPCISVMFMLSLIINFSRSCSTFPRWKNVRVCGFASTFNRECGLPTFRTYRRTKTFPNHVEAFYRFVCNSMYSFGDIMDSSRVVSIFVFARHELFSANVVFSLPLGILLL